MATSKPIPIQCQFCRKGLVVVPADGTPARHDCIALMPYGSKIVPVEVHVTFVARVPREVVP